MFAIATALVTEAASSGMPHAEIEQNIYLQCFESFQWQDFEAISNGTHPLWVACSHQTTQMFGRLARALKELDILRYKRLAYHTLNHHYHCRPLEPRACFKSAQWGKLNVQQRIDVQKDAASSFARLGPLDYHDYVHDATTATVKLGWGINVCSRPYFAAHWDLKEGYQVWDDARVVFSSRRQLLTLEDIHGARLLTCSFSESADWLAAFNAMYLKVYAPGNLPLKWRELE